MSIRSVIADDEALARAVLRSFLNADKSIEIVAETQDGPETVRVVNELRPDLLFLDVQMPGATGFGVLKELHEATVPIVIFVTAFDSFAVQAFDVHAQDFLLKPFTQARFRESLDRAKRQLAMLATYGIGESGTLSGGGGTVAPPSPTIPDRLAVRYLGRTILVQPDKISWAEAMENYVCLYVEGKKYVVRATLSQLRERLSAQKFVRIHRGIVVNVQLISHLIPKGHSDYSVVLEDGTTLKLSRHYREQLFSALPFARRRSGPR